MNIKVTKSSEPSFWYSNYIGSIFEVTDDNTMENNYFVLHQNICNTYLVNVQDCIITEEPACVMRNIPQVIKIIVCPKCGVQLEVCLNKIEGDEK